MLYEVKCFEIKNNLCLLTIYGNGDGISNNCLLEDEFKNLIKVKSVAMKNNIQQDTILVIEYVNRKENIGTKLIKKEVF